MGENKAARWKARHSAAFRTCSLWTKWWNSKKWASISPAGCNSSQGRAITETWQMVVPHIIGNVRWPGTLNDDFMLGGCEGLEWWSVDYFRPSNSALFYGMKKGETVEYQGWFQTCLCWQTGSCRVPSLQAPGCFCGSGWSRKRVWPCGLKRNSVKVAGL